MLHFSILGRKSDASKGQPCDSMAVGSAWLHVLDETYDGSLPAFVAAFAQTKKISRAEAATIKEIIDKFLDE